MKQYDKNSLIGFVLMAIILIIFNTFFFPEIPQQETNASNEAPITDSQITKRTTTPIISPKTNDTLIFSIGFYEEDKYILTSGCSPI